MSIAYGVKITLPNPAESHLSLNTFYLLLKFIKDRNCVDGRYSSLPRLQIAQGVNSNGECVVCMRARQVMAKH